MRKYATHGYCCEGRNTAASQSTNFTASSRMENIEMYMPEATLHLEKPFTDPVCGMNVGANPEKTVVHADTEYHFCSMGCVAKFKADPQKYLDPKPVEELAAIAGATYTCPMHPEIRQPAPGTCPKCGMALEPEMSSLDDGENPELIDFRHRLWWTLPLSVSVFALAMFGFFIKIGLSSHSVRRLSCGLAGPSSSAGYSHSSIAALTCGR
jgi:YHS domain-containing protein